VAISSKPPAGGLLLFGPPSRSHIGRHLMSRAPLISDPQGVPVVGRDEHLPPVLAEYLQAPALRARFATMPAWQPETRGDGRVLNDRPSSAAAVLVPLVVRGEGLQVLLTRRTDHLHDHAGQISFPGGRSDPADADAVATALREAEEEVGLAARHVEVLGKLPTYTTVTAYEVTPVVALVHAPFDLSLDAFEVAEAFEVPLSFLMTPANHHRHRFEIDGLQRHFLSMPWDGVDAEGRPRRYFIWGATAAMLRNLYRFLSA
jgi:8-oxo-dGTP pyrophosphatase MutT (NUDIX family)